MNEEAVYLLKMLGGFVRGESPGEFRGDGKRLLQLAEIHKVTGIAGYMLKKYPQPAAAEVSQYLWQCSLDSLLVFAGRNERMRELNSVLEAGGVDVLLFKGYILKDFYPVPELRSFYDIDFLIHLEDRLKVDKIMIERGFERKTDWEPVYGYYRGNEFYEIHTDIMEVAVNNSADHNAYFKDIWAHALKTGEHTFEIQPEYHFIYLLTHIAKHINNSGAGIRLYSDIAVFFKHYEDSLDWCLVASELERLGLAKFAGTVCAFVERFLGVKSPLILPPTDENVLIEFAEYTLEGGIFGRYGRSQGLLDANKKNKNRKKISRVSAFLQMLFPPLKDMRKKYTYLEKCPWLIVFAWFHRFFNTRRDFKAHFEELVGIFKSKPEEIETLKNLIEDIGL